MSDGVEGDDVRRGGGRARHRSSEDTDESPVAGAELATHLQQAWLTAGRPAVTTVGDLVGYAPETVHRVLAGETAPTWHLVRKLGDVLSVPPETVHQLWYPLWMAADQHRRGRPTPAGARPDGAECDACGAWVVNAPQHEVWHRWMETQAQALGGAHQWANLRDSLPRRDKYRDR